MNKQYKDLNINEKINVKSWGHWRLSNKKGFMLTMVDNANFTRHHLAAPYQYKSPKHKEIVAVSYSGEKYYNSHMCR